MQGLRHYISLVEDATNGSNTLFHGTSLYNLLRIIKDNTIKGDIVGDGYHYGVSLTSSFDTAAHFAVMAESHFASMHRLDDLAEGAVIAFDRNRLAAQAGLTEVDFYGEDEEEEERTHGDITPALASVTAIFVSEEDLSRMRDLIASKPKLAKLAPALQALLDSRLLKVSALA